MFRNLFIFALFATACGYAFASDGMPVWPAPGSDADVRFCDDGALAIGDIGYCTDGAENVRMVSKIGEDLVVENNFNLSGWSATQSLGEGWSGGADMTQMYQAPAGFNIYEGQAQMPLMHLEMLEDDGGAVLAVSQSNRKKVRELERVMLQSSGNNGASAEFAEFEIEEDDGASASVPAAQDLVRSWVVASGQTLRGVLQEWCDKEGWDLVWNTPREYPIVASAVFKGRFMDVASALVRNFSRVNPIPYAKFYKGNRVLVISTSDE
jgi:type IV pili sensor histidine kinase/response regulator